MMGSQFSHNIQFLRRASGLLENGRFLSQVEFAQKIDVDRRTVINWESDMSNPSPRHKQKILAIIKKVFDIDIHESVLIEKDLEQVLGHISIFLNPELCKGLTPQQRQMMNRIFFRIQNLSVESLRQILDIVDSQLKQVGD